MFESSAITEHLLKVRSCPLCRSSMTILDMLPKDNHLKKTIEMFRNRVHVKGKRWVLAHFGEYGEGIYTEFSSSM
jgi:hypothetical protein